MTLLAPLQLTVLFASSNPGKAGEVRTIGQQFGFRIVFPDRALEIEEVGISYLENAALKAETYFRSSGVPVLGDDSGLEIAALGGGPGLLSARFAGSGGSMAQNRAKVLELMQGIADRRALFRCVLFLRINSNCVVTSEDTLLGSIARSERGAGGFGYDSIIEIAGYEGRTLAELKEQGVQVSTHRIKALHAIFSRARQLPLDVWPQTAR